MTIISIDCAEIVDKAGFHAAVAEALSFPEWYGKNLDALHDCLTDIFTDIQIQFVNWAKLEETLGSYTAAIQCAMSRASGENPCIQVFFG